MRYLDADALRVALPMAEAIAAMVPAFGDDREIPLRARLGSSLFMPGRVGSHSGVKVVSTVPGSPSGIVVVFGPDGAPIGIVDGPTLTAIRTGAGAGLATRLLARPEASTLAMLGAGAMAFDQVEAVRAVRPIERVSVWSRDLGHAEALAGRIPGGRAVRDPVEAVTEAHVVSTATPATDPLFPADAVRPGTHINAVGAFTPEMCEIPAEAVRRAFVVVDDRAAAAEEAGDLIRAGVEPHATISELLSGREVDDGVDLTMFKSVGIASQDITAAVSALLRAQDMDLGVVL